MAKIKLHNILQASDQAFLTLQLGASKAELLPSILYAIREEGISIPFLVQSTDHHGNSTFSLTIAQHNLDWVRAALQEGLDLPPTTALHVKEDIALMTLYGPHFGEIPGIASRIFSALAAEGVEVLALSASVNSSLLVIFRKSLLKSFRALNRIFEIPLPPQPPEERSGEGFG